MVDSSAPRAFGIWFLALAPTFACTVGPGDTPEETATTSTDTGSSGGSGSGTGTSCEPSDRCDCDDPTEPCDGATCTCPCPLPPSCEGTGSGPGTGSGAGPGGGPGGMGTSGGAGTSGGMGATGAGASSGAGSAGGTFGSTTGGGSQSGGSSGGVGGTTMPGSTTGGTGAGTTGGFVCDPQPVDPALCLVPNDYENHEICAALPLAIEAQGACGTDCTSIEDIFCTDFDAWYRIELENKRLYKVEPSPDYLVDFEVYRPLVPSPATLADLEQIVNPFDSAADMDKYFVVDGPKGQSTEVYIRVRSHDGNQNGSLTVTAYPEVYDCVDPMLTMKGRQHFFASPQDGIELSNYVGGLRDWNSVSDPSQQPASPGSGVVNIEACRKTLIDPNDPSLGFATMEVVRCVDGQLEVVYDCTTDFPNWTPDLAATYGPLFCSDDANPAGRLWCVPIGDNGPTDLGTCRLYEVYGGKTTCYEDPITGQSRYLFACASNAGHYFDDDPSLYNPQGITEEGYATSLDCQDAQALGLQPDEAAVAECGVGPLSGYAECMNWRQLDAKAEVPDPTPYPSDPAVNDFPRTQNMVSCGPPGEGNELPYVLVDALSGIYTDHHVAMARDAIAAWHDDGLTYLGYLNFTGPEGKTTWAEAPGSNGGSWSNIGYQYGYWATKLADDIGDPGGDYTAFETGCYDADQDGVDNVTDNCPLTWNPATAGRQDDSDGDGLGDACDPNPGQYDGNPDGDGIPPDQDNCPLISNPGQIDSDNNGLGDDCQTTAQTENGTVAVTCDPTATVACVRPDGTAQAASQPMAWAWDIGQSRAQDLMIAWTKLAALAGARGMTYDIAMMGDCFSDDAVARFHIFAENRGSLDHSLDGSTDPNDAARLRAYWAMAEEHGGDEATNTHPDWSSFDIRAVRLSMGDGFASSATGRAWELFRSDVTTAFMERLRTEMETFMAAMAPGESFVTFFNQGSSNQYGWKRTVQGQTVTYTPLKDIAGSETFIYSGHPTSGANDCIGAAGQFYPANETAELFLDMHDQDGMRFWSWNFPENLPDDRPILFGAEIYAAGGIYQAPFCSVEEHYPLGGYTRPNYTMRRAQAPLAPFVSRNWDTLNLPRATGQIALLFPQSVSSACQPHAQPEGRAAESLYRALRSLHYTVDVLGRGPFAMGRADLPDPLDLATYDFVVLAHANLSNEMITVVEQYVADGGTVVVLGTPGMMDEWCGTSQDRSGFAAHFAGFGVHPSGSGVFVQLDGDPAVPSQVALQTGGMTLAAFDAFEYLEGPNAAVRLCDGDPLVEPDLEAARAQAIGWLGTTLSDLGLPPPNVRGTFGPKIHVVERAGTQGPVYHLVNYGLDPVVYDDYHDGNLAGPNNYVDRTATFGCVRPATGDLVLPVPASLQATGGKARVTLLDYGPVDAPFFPFTDHPASVCATAPLAGVYPTPDNGFAYPEVEVSFEPGATEVTIPNLTMKQWAIVRLLP